MVCLLSLFFFKQKTAYEIMPSLVGSEMCIRDSPQRARGLSHDRTQSRSDSVTIGLGHNTERARSAAPTSPASWPSSARQISAIGRCPRPVRDSAYAARVGTSSRSPAAGTCLLYTSEPTRLGMISYAV